MEVQNTKSGYAFTRNPIILKESYSGADFDAAGGIVRIGLAGSTVFEGRFFPPLDLDVSEIVDATVDYFPEPVLTGAPFVRVLDGMSLAERWQILVSAEYDRIEYEATVIAVPGGISKRNYREFPDSDIFSRRFLSLSHNFFMTTRTDGDTLNIKETELAPLYFLNKSSCRVGIKDRISGISFAENLQPGLWAMDPEALRRYFFDVSGVLVQAFSIYRDYIPAVNVVIGKTSPAPERYRLKFRNSLGVFEVVELVGKLSLSDSGNDQENSEFRRYNRDTASFSYERERIETRQKATITTTVENTQSMIFLLDMAGSDEVYLLDIASAPVKVIPTVEQQYDARQEEPKKLTVSLSLADEDAPLIPAATSGTNISKRIFSKEFSKQFN